MEHGTNISLGESLNQEFRNYCYMLYVTCYMKHVGTRNEKFSSRH